MATATTGDRSMTRVQVDRQKAPLELDLIAFFKELQADVFEILEGGSDNGQTPDEIIAKIESLFEGPGGE